MLIAKASTYSTRESEFVYRPYSDNKQHLKESTVPNAYSTLMQHIKHHALCACRIVTAGLRALSTPENLPYESPVTHHPTQSVSVANKTPCNYCRRPRVSLTAIVLSVDLRGICSVLSSERLVFHFAQGACDFVFQSLADA